MPEPLPKQRIDSPCHLGSPHAPAERLFHAIYQAELGVADALAVNVTLSGERNWSKYVCCSGEPPKKAVCLSGCLKCANLGNGASQPHRVPFETGHYNLKNGEVAVAAVGLNHTERVDHLAWDVEAFEAAWNAQSWPTMRILAGTSSTLPQIIQRMEQGVPLWKALLLLAVAALAAETLFLRLWKPSSKA